MFCNIYAALNKLWHKFRKSTTLGSISMSGKCLFGFQKMTFSIILQWSVWNPHPKPNISLSSVNLCLNTYVYLLPAAVLLWGLRHLHNQNNPEQHSSPFWSVKVLFYVCTVWREYLSVLTTNRQGETPVSSIRVTPPSGLSTT